MKDKLSFVQHQLCTVCLQQGMWNTLGRYSGISPSINPHEPQAPASTLFERYTDNRYEDWRRAWTFLIGLELSKSSAGRAVAADTAARKQLLV